jgi:hypothetical protein
MKNRFLSVLLIVLSGAIVNAKNNSGDQAIVALAQTGTQLYLAKQEHEGHLPTEKNYRKELYWLTKNNPLFYKLDRFEKNLSYYIAVLTDHIKVLEGKIILKENGLNSSGMRSGAVVSVLSLLSASASASFFNYSKMMSDPICSQECMTAAISLGIVSAAFAGIAGAQFYKVSRYAQRLIERLERDKKILKDLEQEKAELDIKKANETAEKVNNGLNALVEAFTTAIQGSFVPAAAAQPVAVIQPIQGNLSK